MVLVLLASAALLKRRIASQTRPHDASPTNQSADPRLVLCCAPPSLAAARKAMRIASDSCIYTNDVYTSLHIDGEGKVSEVDIKAAAGSGGSSEGSAGSGSGGST